MKKITLLVALLVVSSFTIFAQPGKGIRWSRDGRATLKAEPQGIVATPLSGAEPTVMVPAGKYTPAGAAKALPVRDFSFSADEKKLLIYTNSKKVWRYETRGDYWLLDLTTGKLQQLGKGHAASSLMFAKLSPDGTKAAYVSEHNLYVEDLATGAIKALTTNGTRRFINGTFDWAYEEEFGCRDGFRWSPDSKSIAYWQIDATKIRDFLMINNTDSIYSFNVPVEYPVAGQSPSACRVGVVDIATADTRWMNVPGDQQQHYIPRMEWVPGKKQLIIQQLNRKQNESKIMLCDATNGKVHTLYEEKDSAWIDVKSRWDDDNIAGWDFIRHGKDFIWVSEQDGWRHLYSISTESGKATLLTPGNYDVITISKIDEAGSQIWFTASPDNAVQEYLYRIPLSGGKADRITPADQPGSHEYNISPYSSWAVHSFSNACMYPVSENVELPAHKSSAEVGQALKQAAAAGKCVEYFEVQTADGINIGGWMRKPKNFDPSKKYPIVFYVYGEPAGATTRDVAGAGRNFLYDGDMAADGYIYASMDNRGTPLPKGRYWRKSIYRKVGVLNARDQAQAAQALMKKYAYIDPARTAVWGWSGGGSMTLNLMFQYPEIYKTGIAIAAVGNQLTYDNIYQERYMGLPEENREDFVKGSPISYAKNLQGNLLYIHGTGDDNVHYQNAEMLLNELIKYNKQIQFMAYPNRTHSISEGEGTFTHLSTLYTNYLRAHCEPGAK
ncbi:S9 family peptidase [Chitinophaga varians]|uniref:S9 family peptidase n=1 Tax=Chitinophaga varians TaxID=2202339 RepID=UPI00165F400D|nr:DPP IV N-terminal domain-containing protein [Chitinophaga varians]MBC9910243.1 S9 family peptidase [Chitinophaga varians]